MLELTQKYKHPTVIHFTKSIFQKLGSSVFAEAAFGGLLQSPMLRPFSSETAGIPFLQICLGAMQNKGQALKECRESNSLHLSRPGDSEAGNSRKEPVF